MRSTTILRSGPVPPSRQALLLGALLWACGLAPAGADQGPDYSGFGVGTFLTYLTAQDGTSLPHLSVSFGAAAFPVVVDTGSTGVVVSAFRIPHVDTLPSRPGQIIYNSSGRIMIGKWVTTAMTLTGRNGATVATAPIPVLAVTRISCVPNAPRCTRATNPKHVAMMGVGFDRESAGQEQSTPDTNPFLNQAPHGSDPVRRGYVVTHTGVHIGLTRVNTQGDFHFVKLDPDNSIAVPEWQRPPMCVTVGDAAAPVCSGTVLVDTGVTAMYLTLPGGPAELAKGTSLGFTFPGRLDGGAQAAYGFTVGDTTNALAPQAVSVNTTRTIPFVNTGLHFLNGFDVLYDADGGFFAYRPTQAIPDTRQ